LTAASAAVNGLIIVLANNQPCLLIIRVIGAP
jgi:hypothetical protein